MRILLFITVILLVSCSGKSPERSSADSLKSKIESFDSAKPISEIDRDNSWVPFHAAYSFDSFPIKRYSGKPAAPDFSTVKYGSDPNFRKFMRERINDVPVNFAGRYAIVEKSCGALCVAIYVVDRKTGKIFDYFPPEGDGRWGYKYHPNSSLLIANSELLNDSMTKYMNGWKMEPEFYQWTGTSFKLLR